MKTLTLSPHVLTLVRDYGHNKAVAWLEGEEELAKPDDDLCSFLSRHDVEFDHLIESDRDALRDLYLEAVKSTMSSRYTPPVSTQSHGDEEEGCSVCGTLSAPVAGICQYCRNPYHVVMAADPQPTGSDSAGLLEMAKKSLDDLLKSANRVADRGAQTGPQWTLLTASILGAKSTLKKLNA